MGILVGVSVCCVGKVVGVDAKQISHVAHAQNVHLDRHAYGHVCTHLPH